jgi:type II secretory pathway predicted ATPase ExeA
MYESYWKLLQKPFESCCDPRFYYPGESHQAALLKLRYAVENQRGGAILAGPSGSGKTLLIAMLRTLLAKRFAPIAHLVFPQMPTDQLLAYLAGELTGDPVTHGAAELHHSVRRIEHFLAENSEHGQHAVVVIDEAHLLDDGQTWEALRLLLNFQSDGKPGLTLLLTGQTGILPTLDRIPQMEERLGVKCLLRPFTAAETGEYATHRLTIAGADPGILDADALAALHRLSHGIARRINRLCDLALLIGFAEKRKSITADQFESIHQELVAVVPE